MESLERKQSSAEQPEPAVVAAWVENHRRFLAFLERRVESRAAAEEILQEAFVRGLGQADEIRDDERAVAWFYRLLRNAVIDHYRARGAEARGLEALARELADASAPPPEIEAALCRCFEALLPALRPNTARSCAGSTSKEAGRRLRREAGLTANNAMVRLHRARKALRADSSAPATCADHGCLDCSCGVRVSR
jgi:RNA polymerase sigma-70 factor (ECF subfamily)